MWGMMHGSGQTKQAFEISWILPASAGVVHVGFSGHRQNEGEYDLLVHVVHPLPHTHSLTN